MKPYREIYNMDCTLDEVKPFLTLDLIETLLELQEIFDDLDKMEEEFALELDDKLDTEELQESFEDLEDIFEKLLQEEGNENDN